MDYFYYITKKPYDNASQSTSKLPIISKIKKDRLSLLIKAVDPNEFEGPFSSLFDLKKKSKILAEIKLQKHRSRILKSSNIKEFIDIILTNEGSSFEKTFIDAFGHVTVGKISKKTVKRNSFL